MPFVGPNGSTFETDEQELARLAGKLEGSYSQTLSTLPVTAPVVEIESIIELPDKVHDGERIVVFVNRRTMHRRTLDEVNNRMLRNANYECVVVGGDSKEYPVGGNWFNVGEEELRRGRRIIL